MTHDYHEAFVHLVHSYLTIPIGSLLNVHGVSEFSVGQWACLPSLPQGDGIWSSSDPSLLWIDNKSKFMLPLRPGHVHLQFTPNSSSKLGIHPALLGKLTLINVCSKSGHEPQVKSSIMPVGLDSAHEVAIHVELVPRTVSSTDGSVDNI